MNKTIVLCISLLILCNRTWSQHTIALSGYVADSQTGEKLIGASVTDSASRTGITTNNYGFFSISLNKGYHTLIVSYVGYKPMELRSVFIKDTLVLLGLSSHSQIDEVTVSAENPNRIQSLNSPGLKNLPMKLVKQLPVIMGEQDLLKTLQLLPGVQSGSEANTGLYVRGGESDNNLILLDGADVFNPNHLFGFFSLFNEDAVKSVKLYTSGFPSQYNGRLASVVDIRMKDGNSYTTKANGSIGLISSKFQVEGPIVKEKLTYILSYRRTYLDLFSKPIIRHFTSYSDAGYYFFDLNARVHWKINDHNSLYLSNYCGKDKGFFDTDKKYGTNPPEENMGFTEAINRQEVKWGNNLLIFRYEHLFSRKLFMNVRASMSNYSYHSLDDNSNLDIYWQYGSLVQQQSVYSLKTNSSIKKQALSVEFEHYLSNAQHLSYGIGDEYYRMNPAVENFDIYSDSGVYNQRYSNHCYYAYLQDEISIGKKLVLKPGLNLSCYVSDNKTVTKLAKRFYIQYQATPKLELHAGYAEMSQYLHLLTLTRISLASDLWLPSSGGIKPSGSTDKSAGFSISFTKGISAGIDIYRRLYTNLLLYKEGLSFTSHYNSYAEMVTSGKGKAGGVEINIEKSSGSLTGMLSYCYSFSHRYFKELNQGNPFRAEYDRPHSLKLLVVKTLNERWSCGLVFNLMSGSMQTMGSARYVSWFDYGESPYDKWTTNTCSGENIVLYKKNTYRLPVYHRLDLSATYTIAKKNHKSSVNFGLYNAYNAKNTYMAQLEMVSIGNNKNVYTINNKSLFPVIPFLSYRFEF